MNIFGTDGVRGKVNQWPMTAELIQKVAISAAKIYFGKGGSNLNRVIIGKDTRLSGYMLEPALVSGFTSMGMDCLTLGPIPTPGVSRLTRSFRADLGVMISASHNPSEDNGIKLFGPDGLKLSDNMENKISSLVKKEIKLAAPDKLGRVKRLDDAVGRYIEAVKSCIDKNQRLVYDYVGIFEDTPYFPYKVIGYFVLIFLKLFWSIVPNSLDMPYTLLRWFKPSFLKQ